MPNNIVVIIDEDTARKLGINLSPSFEGDGEQTQHNGMDVYVATV